jgi:hypothetical protein
LGGGECFDVGVLSDMGPMLPQNLLAKLINLAKRYSFKAAGTLQAKAETANAAE